MSAPSSTYRLQIRQSFTLAQAGQLADYLRTLGVGAIYVSPILQATSGSDHGYDITDHRQVDPERGGESERLEMVEAARAQGLQIVVDIVPNHMGVAEAAQNAPWWDLLKLGRQSVFSSWFDVDWLAAESRVKLPVLGDDFTPDQLTLATGDDGELELRYFDNRYPVAAGTGELGDDAAKVHEHQHYQLVNYRRADTEQNYRRFFAVTDLASILVEDQAVFDATHKEILRWVSTGGADGIRIDHPDGLADPGEYLERLAAAAPDAWITVEKITEPGELLPSNWPVAGTTGYDALTELNSLLYNPADADEASRQYAELTGDTRDWTAHVEQGKRLMTDTILRAEILRICRVLARSGQVTGTSDEIEAALTELAVAFGVYRSYQPLGGERLTQAIELALSRKPELRSTIAELEPLLSGGDPEATVRFEQATGAIMAKGVEDTACYRYNRAVGLNEVGGDPGDFGSSVQQFHDAQQLRQERSPETMTTLSTHDTKRSEDVRARLAVLPELGDRWYDTARQLLEKVPVGNQAFGYLIWQTFAGAGWIERDRMHAYIEKAMREATEGTGWRDSDPAFEKTVQDAVDRAYDDPEIHSLLDVIITEITPYGWSNSLSQKLLQLAMPGIPDVYQGTELFDYSLVDPDNRRTVDFAERRTLLAGLNAGSPPLIDEGGAAKLWLTRQALHWRRAHPELYTGYTPLLASGPAAEHAVAFDRGGVIAIGTRLPYTLQQSGGWRDTTLQLPEGRYRDLLSGRELDGEQELTRLTRSYPVALLVSAI